MVAAEPYTVDWREQERRPFRRGFIPYGPGEGDPEQAAEQRKALGISVVEDPAGDDATPPPVESFEELGALPPWLLESLRDSETYEPTPLQAQALPIVLAGQNLVATARQSADQASTCAMLSAVHLEDQAQLSPDDPGPVVLVLTSTQELAGKFANDVNALLKHSKRSLKHVEGIRCVNVSGGGARSEKLKELGDAGAHIVVGTAKRVHDMASKEQMSLLRVTLFILDGVDKVLDLGFAKEIGDLASWIRPERQSVLLAGTWPRLAADLAKELCFSGGPPVHIAVSEVRPGAGAAKRKRPADAGKGPAGKGKAAKRLTPSGKAPQPAAKKAEEVEEFPDDW